MAKDSNTGANLGSENELWRAADTFRSNMDVAEYKHVVPGLLFVNSNHTTWGQAKMNHAIPSIDANLGPEHANSFHRDLQHILHADDSLCGAHQHKKCSLVRRSVR